MLTWQLFISAFVLGLFSSFHCVGMCGAIAFSLPTQGLIPLKKVTGIVLYNAGRISVYALMGLLFGLLGRQIYLAGFQQWFSIFAGTSILIIVFVSMFKSGMRLLPGFTAINFTIQKIIARLLHKPGVASMFLLGMANGLLPCGLVYFAITGALAAGSATMAVLFMMVFGLGTFPAMFLVSYFGYRINISVRQKIKTAMPFVMAFMGMLLVLRGLGLGIPYVSPFVPGAPKQAVVCH